MSAVLFAPGVVRGSNEVTGREPEGNRNVVLFEDLGVSGAWGPT
jgi:hypothetical protein